MSFLQLPSEEWDYDNLTARQDIEVFATLMSYIYYPLDKGKRLGFKDTCNKSLLKEMGVSSDASIKSVLLFALRGNPIDIAKKINHRGKALHKIVQYLCRMKEHHDDQLLGGASLAKAFFLTRKWADRKSLRGFSENTLKNLWATHKEFSPLYASMQANRKRALKYARERETDKSANVYELACIISRSSSVLQNAVYIQSVLSDTCVWGIRPPISQRNDQMFIPTHLRITPLPIRRKQLKESELVFFDDETFTKAVEKIK